MNVTVLGAGSWGTTVAALIARRHSTMLWARNAETAAEIDGNHTNVCVPTRVHAARAADGHRRPGEGDAPCGAAHRRRPDDGHAGDAAHGEGVDPPWIPIVSLSKGLEQGSLLRMTEVIADEIPGHPVAALTGPNIAREIMAGQAAASVIATDDLKVARAIQSVLTRGVFRIYTNHDVIGCELGGALKNVVAIACGIAQGLGVGDNTRSMVMTRGLAELTRLGVAMGGEAQTFAGLAGMGDLVTTCLSPFSRNRTVGEQLGLGRTLPEITADMNMVAEGLKTAVTSHELAERHDLDMPVHEEIYRVVVGESDAAHSYRGLRTQPGHELDPG